MLYALRDEVKTLATPGDRANCPACSGEVIAKCGDINIWHWAHKDTVDCDTWHEPETKWHLAWKSMFPSSWAEVPVIKYGKKHIADIIRPDGLVIEFQHSPISPDQIRSREIFYQNMIWVFDIQECAEQHPSGGCVWTGDHLHHFTEARFEVRRNINKNYWTFRWKHPRKHVACTTSDCYLDIGNGLFQLKKMYIDEPPYGGWGYKVNMIDFLARYRDTQYDNQLVR